MDDWEKEILLEFEKEYKETALHLAAGKGDFVRVKELIEEGRDVNAFDVDLSWTPLHYAAESAQIEMMKYLISAGADVNAYQIERIGTTLLGLVAQICSFEVAKIGITKL